MSARACRIDARFAWSKEAPDHVNPGAQHEAFRGWPFELAGRLVPPSKLYEGYEASMLACFTRRPSGRRRRDACRPVRANELSDMTRRASRKSAIKEPASALGGRLREIWRATPMLAAEDPHFLWNLLASAGLLPQASEDPWNQLPLRLNEMPIFSPTDLGGDGGAPHRADLRQLGA